MILGSVEKLFDACVISLEDALQNSDAVGQFFARHVGASQVGNSPQLHVSNFALAVIDPGSILLYFLISVLAMITAAIVWRFINKPRRGPFIPQHLQPRTIYSILHQPPPHRQERPTAISGTGTIRKVCDTQPQGGYVLCNDPLPMSNQVHEQICALARSPTPNSALLLSTSPPTIKMTESGPAPVVTELRSVPSLENFQGLSKDARNTVGSFHNHLNDLSLSQHDSRIFQNLDRLLGPKYHVVGSRQGLRIYVASNQNPVVQSAGK